MALLLVSSGYSIKCGRSLFGSQDTKRMEIYCVISAAGIVLILCAHKVLCLNWALHVYGDWRTLNVVFVISYHSLLTCLHGLKNFAMTMNLYKNFNALKYFVNAFYEQNNLYGPSVSQLFISESRNVRM